MTKIGATSVRIARIRSHPLFTDAAHRSNNQTAMRYFFHIFDGPKVFPDEVEKILSSPEVAISQANAIAAELSRAGELCRTNLVFVLDEDGKNIFRCKAA
jgi:hypothetical protein